MDNSGSIVIGLAVIYNEQINFRQHIASPLEVVQAGAQMAVNGDLWTHIFISFNRALTGFIIGGGLGLIFGLLNGIYPIAEKHLDTTVQMFRNIPHLALIPLIILWFGVGEEPKVILVAIGVFFPIYINTYHGIRSVDKGLIEMGNVYRLSRQKLFFKNCTGEHCHLF